jgi:predicted permease
LLCALALVAFVVWSSRNSRIDWNDASFGALVAVFPNTGFMGVPLLVALLGDTAAGPVIGAILVDLILTSTLCLALAQASTHRSAGADERSMLHAAARSLRGALGNPLPWAIVIGALFAAFDRELPGPLAQIVRMLGDSATPVALFTIGTVLQRAGRHAHARTPMRLYLPVALYKLLIHPALVFGLGSAAKAMGAPVTGFGLMVLTLVAALPSASTVSVLAERYGADNGRSARIIMASTVLAFGSFTGLAWWFDVGKGMP